MTETTPPALNDLAADSTTRDAISHDSANAEQAFNFHITKRAGAKIMAERLKRHQPDLVFRITVLGGGCSGLQYKFGYDDQPLQDGDTLFPATEQWVVTDAMSLPFLNGATLDYEKDLMGARFAIKNPN